MARVLRDPPPPGAVKEKARVEALEAVSTNTATLFPPGLANRGERAGATLTGRQAEFAYALLRVVVGSLFACHGAQKVLGAFGGAPIQSGLLVAAGWIELVAGLLVAFGILTTPAALLASGEMAVAYFKVHAPQSFWPILNKGELAVVYCLLFLFVAAAGGGAISLDAAIRRARLRIF